MLTGFVSNISPGPPDENSQNVTLSIGTVGNPSLFASGPTVDAAGNISYTLASDASGTSTVEVVATDSGPSAPPNDDTSSQTLTVKVLSAQDQLLDLIDVVENLGLNGGNTNALTSKLNNAIGKLSQGDLNAAVNKINAFINQINAFVNSGKLTQAQADDLISAANAAIASAGPGGATLVIDGTSGDGNHAAELVSDRGDLVVDLLYVFLMDN